MIRWGRLGHHPRPLWGPRLRGLVFVFAGPPLGLDGGLPSPLPFRGLFLSQLLNLGEVFTVRALGMRSRVQTRSPPAMIGLG
jgi:hypothetical protein